MHKNTGSAAIMPARPNSMPPADKSSTTYTGCSPVAPAIRKGDRKKPSICCTATRSVSSFSSTSVTMPNRSPSVSVTRNRR